MAYALYIATAAGAVSLYLMMPRGRAAVARLGMLLGGATLGGLFLLLSQNLPTGLGVSDAAMGYQYVFSFLAIAAAARVITHDRPVYSALWFIMVVLASAGLFLTLDAEFMAFAMVIIYGGAILVTYVFVIMLAANSGDAEGDASGAECDRVAREPAAAILTGFILLAALLSVYFQPVQQVPGMAAAADSVVISQTLTQRPVEVLAQRVGTDLPEELANRTRLENVERVGLDLFREHPLGLELAGIILLVSLVGAVIIARKQVEAQPRS